MTPNRDATRSAPLGVEIVDGGVGEFEPYRQVSRRALAGAREHRLGNVEPQDFAAGADARGEVDRRRAAAAADVDHALSGLSGPPRR